MASFTDTISDDLREVLLAQHVFFVATAADGARINLSPKGMASFAVLDDRTVGYLDLTGSGNETAAHLLADGRITIMFCRFDRTADIIRLYGRGRAAAVDTPDFARVADGLEVLPGTRQAIVVDVASVQTSCGYAVPLMEHVAERDTLVRWAERKGPDGLDAYRAEKNAESIDGLVAPGF